MRRPTVDAGKAESQRVIAAASTDPPIYTLVSGVGGVGKTAAGEAGIVIVDRAINAAKARGVFLDGYG